MRQRVTIILTILIVVGVLVVINIVTHVKEEPPGDSELQPKRTTYHAGPTGTRALYDFMSEGGFPVMRWREVPAKLLNGPGQKIRTYVIIGPTELPFTNDETRELLEWVDKGGRLVIVDRYPPGNLLPQSGNWRITSTEAVYPTIDVDPGNPSEMTGNVTAIRPAQPTTITSGIQSVLPSRFAAKIEVVEASRGDGASKASAMTKYANAPVVHLADKNGALLIDYAYGNGRIVLLGDPYVVSNGGINLNDNLLLAVNMLTSAGGLIAFDEYHQGRGISANPFASYFSGTPVLAIGSQLLLLILFMLWTRSRRFARPLPLVQVDRRSSLEFVASMAELQERARAFDLAIENIYSRTRRALARHAALDYNSPRSLIASRVASRSGLDAQNLETLMRQCEEAINGVPVSWRQSLDMVHRLREVERVLGLRMRSREVRQAAEKV